MPGKITYYAVLPMTGQSITLMGSSGGLSIRRTALPMRASKDFSWCFTPTIVEWERGDLGQELVEVDHEQASKIIEYFRDRWGPFGQPLDP